jgi:hypothetical protein
VIGRAPGSQPGTDLLRISNSQAIAVGALGSRMPLARLAAAAAAGTSWTRLARGTTALRSAAAALRRDWARASQPTANQSSPGSNRQVIATASFVFTNSVCRSAWLTATAAANSQGAVNHDGRHNRQRANISRSGYIGVKSTEWRCRLAASNAVRSTSILVSRTNVHPGKRACHRAPRTC